MKIVVADKISSSASAVFAEQPDWKVVTTDKDTLPGELATADAILVRSATFVDAAMMEKAPKLRVIRTRRREVSTTSISTRRTSAASW